MTKPVDRERVTRWVNQYGDDLRGYLWSRVRDEDLAEDLLQEVFLRAWRGSDRFVEQGEDRAYLFAIAHRLLRDRWRQRSQRPSHLDASSDVVDEQAIEPRQHWEQIEQEELMLVALDELSEQEQSVLMLRYFGGLGFKEIASTTGNPMNTVLSHAHRGLGKLRQMLLGSSSREER